MTPAKYEDVAANEIPTFALGDTFVKAIAGSARINGEQVNGYFSVEKTTPVYLDLHLQAGASIEVEIEDGLNTFFYVYEGEVLEPNTNAKTPARRLSRVSTEGLLTLTNTGTAETRLILLAGQPIKEPIAQHGPFVMNNFDEINQAIVDFRSGNFAG